MLKKGSEQKMTNHLAEASQWINIEIEKKYIKSLFMCL